MTFIVRALYREGGDQARFPHRVQHIRYMIKWLPHTVFGAAMLDDQGHRACGMIVALSVDTRHEAERFIAEEPYRLAGLFESVEITELKQMTPPYGPELLEQELQRELNAASADKSTPEVR